MTFASSYRVAREIISTRSWENKKQNKGYTGLQILMPKNLLLKVGPCRLNTRQRANHTTTVSSISDKNLLKKEIFQKPVGSTVRISFFSIKLSTASFDSGFKISARPSLLNT